MNNMSRGNKRGKSFFSKGQNYNVVKLPELDQSIDN